MPAVSKHRGPTSAWRLPGFLALVCLAIGAAPAWAAPAPQRRPGPELQAPIQARWTPRAVPKLHKAFWLELQVERRTPNLPLQVVLQLPPEVQLVEGPLQTRWAARQQAGTDRIRWRLRLTGPSAGDIVAVVSGDRRGMGVTAEVPYRFDRPAPTVQVRPATARKWPGGASLQVRTAPRPVRKP